MYSTKTCDGNCLLFPFCHRLCQQLTFSPILRCSLDLQIRRVQVRQSTLTAPVRCHRSPIATPTMANDSSAVSGWPVVGGSCRCNPFSGRESPPRSRVWLASPPPPLSSLMVGSSVCLATVVAGGERTHLGTRARAPLQTPVAAWCVHIVARDSLPPAAALVARLQTCKGGPLLLLSS